MVHTAGMKYYITVDDRIQSHAIYSGDSDRSAAVVLV